VRGTVSEAVRLKERVRVPVVLGVQTGTLVKELVLDRDGGDVVVLVFPTLPVLDGLKDFVLGGDSVLDTETVRDSDAVDRLRALSEVDRVGTTVREPVVDELAMRVAVTLPVDSDTGISEVETVPDGEAVAAGDTVRVAVDRLTGTLEIVTENVGVLVSTSDVGVTVLVRETDVAPVSDGVKVDPVARTRVNVDENDGVTVNPSVGVPVEGLIRFRLSDSVRVVVLLASAHSQNPANSAEANRCIQ